jgi:hypothetical protein
MDRETLSLPTSQFYTAAVSSLTSKLSTIAQTPTEKEEKENFGVLSAPTTAAAAVPTATSTSNPTTPVFELTEEVTAQCNVNPNCI